MQLRVPQAMRTIHNDAGFVRPGTNFVNHPPPPPSEDPMEAVLAGPLYLETAAAPPPAVVSSMPNGEPDDAELVRQCQTGRHDAYATLVTRYRGRVYAMILNMTGNDADAWDLSQDVFLKAWKALPRFEARSQFFTWLYRITHNVTYDWLRKRKIRPGTEFEDGVGQTPAAGAVTVPYVSPEPDTKLRHKETGARIAAALREISPEHRAVVLLKEVDGLSYQEIADTVGCSLGTVMSRLFYARKRLQVLLKDVYENQD